MSGPVVETTGGRVEGFERDGVRVWRGIPYAAAPVGARRFGLPAPHPGWPGVRPAREPGPAPLQPVGPPLGVAVPGMAVGPTSEDCLYLDVWAPADAEGAAVMAWIPGGAFTVGAGSLPTYDGARVAAEGGVVVVAVTYRVGFLGFSALPDGHANLGLVDQCAALAWVQENIAGFGGDRDRVTVFGESAGGGAISHLLAARLARGLFRRAIIQSGATGFTQTLDQARAVTERMLQAGDVRTMDVEALVAAQNEALADLMGTFGVMPLHPCVDGGVVKRTPLDAVAAGDVAGIDLVIGTTAHEMRLYVDVREALGRDRLVARVTALTGSDVSAKSLLAAYDEEGAPSLAHLWSDVCTDADMTTWAERIAAAQSTHQPHTYRYVFTWGAAADDGRLGACHAVDLPFTFGTFDVDDWAPFVGAGPEAERVGRDLRAAWTAFARDGVPGPDWPAYDTTRRTTRIIGPEMAVVDDPRGGIRRAWDAVRPPPSP